MQIRTFLFEKIWLFSEQLDRENTGVKLDQFLNCMLPLTLIYMPLFKNAGLYLPLFPALPSPTAPSRRSTWLVHRGQLIGIRPVDVSESSQIRDTAPPPPAPVRVRPSIRLSVRVSVYPPVCPCVCPCGYPSSVGVSG